MEDVASYDEELPLPPRSRWVSVLAVLAVLAIAGGLAVKLASGGTAHNRPAAASSTATSAPVREIRIDPHSGSRLLLPCAGERGCRLSDSLPPHVLVALRKVFPHVHIVSAHSSIALDDNLVPDALASRTIIARTATQRIHIYVRTPTPGLVIADVKGKTTIRFGVYTLRKYQVVIEAIGTKAHIASQAMLDALGRDRRLVGLS